MRATTVGRIGPGYNGGGGDLRSGRSEGAVRRGHEEMTVPTKAQLQGELDRMRRRLTALERRAERAESALGASGAREEALAHDLAEARAQQTATAEILRVISSSPTDIQPVFDAIVRSAGHLCGAESAVVYRFEDDTAHFVASYNFSPETVESYRRRFPRPLRDTDHLWRIADGSVLNVADIEDDAERSPGHRRDLPRPRRPECGVGPHAPRDQDHRSHQRGAPRRGRVLRRARRAPEHLRRSGGDRHRERAPVHRAARSATASSPRRWSSRRRRRTS